MKFKDVKVGIKIRLNKEGRECLKTPPKYKIMIIEEVTRIEKRKNPDAPFNTYVTTAEVPWGIFIEYIEKVKDRK